MARTKTGARTHVIEIKHRFTGNVLKTVDAETLEGANLTGVREALGIEYDPALPRRIADQVTAHTEAHQQETWHSACGTRHCIAGWATTLSGPLGKHLDVTLGTATAATLLLWRAGCELPSFAADASEADTVGRLRAMAAAIAAEGAVSAPEEPKP